MADAKTRALVAERIFQPPRGTSRARSSRYCKGSTGWGTDCWPAIVVVVVAVSDDSAARLAGGRTTENLARACSWERLEFRVSSVLTATSTSRPSTLQSMRDVALRRA